MKNLKIKPILLLLIVALFVLSSCDCFRVQNVFTYRYDGKYTGIDTLINVDGYYSVPGSTYGNDKVSFFRDGLSASHFFTKRTSYLSLKDNYSLKKMDSGKIKDLIEINSIRGYGLFKICNDTIMTQIFRDSGMGNIGYYEVWYKILSKNKLLILKYNGIDNDCNSCDKYLNQELHFYPAWRPDSSENWLRGCLGEKGKANRMKSKLW